MPFMVVRRLTVEEQHKFDIITKIIKKEIKPGHAA
jgi:hypothetical protein